MPNYVVPGQQVTVSSSYKTAARVNATGSTKRARWNEILLGTTSNPNSTDTFLQWDVSRISATGAGADTSFTPNPKDSADGASVLSAGINATAEATTITANSTLFYHGMNQRNSLRWIAADATQQLVAPATAGGGLILRVLSATYTASCSAQVEYVE
jgi:hypothetical protein